MPKLPMPLAYSLTNSGKALDLSIQSVRRLIQAGELDSFILCGRRLVPRESLEKLVSERAKLKVAESEFPDQESISNDAIGEHARKVTHLAEQLTTLTDRADIGGPKWLTEYKSLVDRIQEAVEPLHKAGQERVLRRSTKEALRDDRSRLNSLDEQLRRIRRRSELLRETDTERRDRVEAEVAMLRSERQGVRLDMQSLVLREQAAEERLFLGGDTAAARRALVAKVRAYHDDYQAKVEEKERLEKAVKELSDGAENSEQKKKAQYQVTIQEGRVAGAKRELTKAIADLDDFDQRHRL